MPAPTNVSFATATDIGSLPATISQDVRDGGVNYTVFYKMTAVAGQQIVGIYAKGDPFTTTVPTGYRPRLIVYDQDLSILTPPYRGLDATNIPLQMPVTVGQTYWFRISSPAGNAPTTAVLSLNVQNFTNTTPTDGAILITDDNIGFPLAILSPTTGAPQRFVWPFPGGEQAIMLPSGIMLVEDIDTAVVQLYGWSGSDPVFVATPAVVFTGNIVISSNQVDTFYVGNSGVAAFVKTVNASTGAVGATTFSLGSVGLTAMCPNLAGTILYYNDSSGSSSVIKRWNLTTNVAMTDFMASVAGYLIHDILNLPDGTFLVSYQKNSATKDLNVLRYNAAGATLNTYAIGSDFASFDQRMCIGADETSFWLFLNLVSITGVSRFLHLKVSDGSTLHDFNHVTYEGGMYGAAEADPPLARFGHANSCPIVILRTPGASPILLKTDTDLDGAGGGGGGGGSSSNDTPAPGGGGGGYTGLGGNDDGELYQAFVKTRTYAPGGSIGVLGDVAHQQQPLLIARNALAGTTISLTIDRDRGLETDVSSVSLVAAGTETRVIRKFEDAGLAEMSLAQFQLGDVAATKQRWSLDRFQIKPTRDGDR